MSQLIQMNQRIQAVETIKKITHATRLIAMSSHTRLAHKEPLLSHYKNQVHHLLSQLLSDDTWQETYFKLGTKDDRTLIILIGSQKGFCGNFNVALFKFFEIKFPTSPEKTDIITIGKKAQDYALKKIGTPLETFNNLSSMTLTNITDILTSFVTSNAHNYKEIIIISNEPKTFFTQKPTKTLLLPMQPIKNNQTSLDAYIWPEDQDTILKMLTKLYLTVSIEAILFSSLVSEQAARFHSMDSATRNAEDLLEIMHRDYNKLRQAKITKELLELTSSFERQ